MDIDARIKHKMEPPPALGPGEGERISHNRTLGITTSITKDVLEKWGLNEITGEGKNIKMKPASQEQEGKR